ncbi:2-octaprenyl-6-methoxyphenol hydroxylase [Rhodobium orientis]|nr:2-octaprenyl-6-methoxyphenol hydroxylase [Rhodobium orientis]
MTRKPIRKETPDDSNAAPAAGPATKMLKADVTIIGGGPAGLVAANVFARSGFHTVLIALKTVPGDRRTTALLAASVEMLRVSGLWPAIAPHTAPLATMRIVDDTGRLFRAPEIAFEANEIGLDAFGYNVENTPLVTCLGASAESRPTLTWLDATAEDIAIGEDAARITASDGTVVETALIAGSDGRNSPSREAAGISVRRWKYRQAAFVANFGHDAPHHNASTEFHTPSGPFTLVPLPGDRSSLVCVARPDAAEELAAMAPDALSAEVERRAHSILGRMDLEGVGQVFPLSSFVAKKFGANRVALIGEAGHGFPPIGAQGLNLSLRDIASLVEIAEDVRRVGGDIGGPKALSRYDRARQPDVWSRTLGVDALNRALLSDFLPVQALRGAGLYLANRVGPLRRIMMREGITPRFRLPKLMRGHKPDPAA